MDGPGFRTSIYFAGCNHRCPGCHNPSSWEFNSGDSYKVSELMQIIAEEDFDVTLSGGDPLYHPIFIKKLIHEIKEHGYSVWIYTGFTWEEIVTDKILYEAISEADVIVDSPFITSLKDKDLLFRGSSNQRIIDIKKSNPSFISLWHR